ncbi:MAG: XRE family transcriptional regulator [Methylobacteriaceae bacterium]|jgi:Zn-dependent peptidase ImmA (M78 family)/transcriptional regulator with XRE-family HTH domain|nr:XRE family transcriptional regulator [Methylobacteriaceae bacterium]
MTHTLNHARAIFTPNSLSLLHFSVATPTPAFAENVPTTDAPRVYPLHVQTVARADCLPVCPSCGVFHLAISISQEYYATSEEKRSMTPNLIGVRLKALREKKGLTQERLSDVFGFKDRQTISAIETGLRTVTADELLKAAKYFKVDPDYFVDPFILAGEGQFSWRRTQATSKQLNDCQTKAERWIALFRELGSEDQAGPGRFFVRPSLRLHKRSSYEEAARIGELFAARFALGNIPAAKLIDVMEDQLHVLVLMIDAPDRISGAACVLPDLDAVLINRRDVPGRRHFDLAHELFHILTWQTMPPEPLETPEYETSGHRRVEHLANNFASALLMPGEILEQDPGWKTADDDILLGWLGQTAEKLQVTADALKWRLVDSGRITRERGKTLNTSALNKTARYGDENLPPLFSKSFMRVLGTGLRRGLISVRRAATLLDVSIDAMSEIFVAHDLAVPYDL